MPKGFKEKKQTKKEKKAQQNKNKNLSQANPIKSDTDYKKEIFFTFEQIFGLQSPDYTLPLDWPERINLKFILDLMRKVRVEEKDKLPILQTQMTAYLLRYMQWAREIKITKQEFVFNLLTMWLEDISIELWVLKPNIPLNIFFEGYNLNLKILKSILQKNQDLITRVIVESIDKFIGNEIEEKQADDHTNNKRLFFLEIMSLFIESCFNLYLHVCVLEEHHKINYANTFYFSLTSIFDEINDFFDFYKTSYFRMDAEDAIVCGMKQWNNSLKNKAVYDNWYKELYPAIKEKVLDPLAKYKKTLIDIQKIGQNRDVFQTFIQNEYPDRKKKFLENMEDLLKKINNETNPLAYHNRMLFFMDLANRLYVHLIKFIEQKFVIGSKVEDKLIINSTVNIKDLFQERFFSNYEVFIKDFVLAYNFLNGAMLNKMKIDWKIGDYASRMNRKNAMPMPELIFRDMTDIGKEEFFHMNNKIGYQFSLEIFEEKSDSTNSHENINSHSYKVQISYQAEEKKLQPIGLFRPLVVESAHNKYTVSTVKRTGEKNMPIKPQPLSENKEEVSLAPIQVTYVSGHSQAQWSYPLQEDNLQLLSVSRVNFAASAKMYVIPSIEFESKYSDLKPEFLTIIDEGKIGDKEGLKKITANERDFLKKNSGGKHHNINFDNCLFKVRFFDNGEWKYRLWLQQIKLKDFPGDVLTISSQEETALFFMPVLLVKDKKNGNHPTIVDAFNPLEEALAFVQSFVEKSQTAYSCGR